MKVERVSDVTTVKSPVQWMVTIRINTLDRREIDYRERLVELIEKAIAGIEP